MSLMKAVLIHNYGPTSALSYEDFQKPSAGEGEILIRVHASSINPFDCAVRAGYLVNWYSYAFPLILGVDVAGVVEELGKGANTVKPGDAVYARTDPAKNGAYAEYVSVSASEIAPMPKSLDYQQAASLPNVALATWRSLVDNANLQPGQTILIHAAAGGVGSFAVQFAKALGAKVIGTASAPNHAFLRQLGADEVIDYNTTRFDDVVHDVDVVLDTVGGETQKRSWKVLKPGGILLSLVEPPSEELAVINGVRQKFTGGFPPAGPVLREIASLVDSGKIKPIIASLHPLKDVAHAQDLVQQQHTRGKRVVQLAQ